MMENWRQTILPESSTLRDAINCLNLTSAQIVIVANSHDVLLGTVSDGDIRRGLLNGLGLDDALKAIMNTSPLVVPNEVNFSTVLQMMLLNKIHQIPIVDKSGKVQGVHLWSNISDTPNTDRTIVIMAGGKGTRLYPHTEKRPKAMLDIAGKPMLMRVIERAKNNGFSKFFISINHLVEQIKNYFGNGEDIGVEISYIEEEKPLGTAGSLFLLRNKIEKPFIVTNCDVITDLNYIEILGFHLKQNAMATMAVRPEEWKNPYGIVELKDDTICGITEKPTFRFHINAGIYVISPNALSYIEANTYQDMPSFFDRLRESGERTVGYPVYEYWRDVGRPADFEAITQDINAGAPSFIH